jgi:hypothetical protein
MNFEIELVPHIGERAGVPVVGLNQYQIFVAGEDLKKVRGVDRELIGYVGKDKGNPINWLKVSLAFGESTRNVFDTMVREALEAAGHSVDDRKSFGPTQADLDAIKSEPEKPLTLEDLADMQNL